MPFRQWNPELSVERIGISSQVAHDVSSGQSQVLSQNDTLSSELNFTQDRVSRHSTSLSHW